MIKSEFPCDHPIDECLLHIDIWLSMMYNYSVPLSYGMIISYWNHILIDYLGDFTSSTSSHSPLRDFQLAQHFVRAWRQNHRHHPRPLVRFGPSPAKLARFGAKTRRNPANTASVGDFFQETSLNFVRAQKRTLGRSNFCMYDNPEETCPRRIRKFGFHHRL